MPEAADLEREKARQRTHDALSRKARAGYVTGGRVFGYSNVDVLRADGKRSHVERQINEEEAAVVRRIFALRAEGVGQSRTAKQLNAERAVAPRAQQGRPRAWAPSSVHAVLFRDLYRGEIVWNRSRKRNDWGAQAQTARPASEWIRVNAPDLRILSDAQWAAAHRQLDAARAAYDRATHGQRRPKRDRDSKYLLPGFGRCDQCEGGLHVRSYASGGRRAFFYACTSHYNRGPEVCAHVDKWPLDEIDREVFATISEKLDAGLVDEVIGEARRMFDASAHADRQHQLQRDLEAVEREHRRLTEAIATGGETIANLMERLRPADSKRRELLALLERTRGAAGVPACREVERRMRRSLADWRSMFTGDVATARQGFRRLLTTPIRFEPFTDERGYRAIRFSGTWGAEAVFGAELVTNVASPPETGRLWYWPIDRQISLVSA